MWPYHSSLRFVTKIRSSLFFPMAVCIFLRTSSLVTWSVCKIVSISSQRQVSFTLFNYFSWLGLDFVLFVARSFGVQLVFFFCSGISVVLFHTLGFSLCQNTFLPSSHLILFIGNIRDLFVPYVDSLVG